MEQGKEVDEDILRFELARKEQIGYGDDHDYPVGDESLCEPFEDIGLAWSFLAYI